MKEELKEMVRSLTPKFLLFYIVGSVVFSLIMDSFFIQWISGFSAALTAINLSASMFALGAPFVLGASLLLPSFKLEKDNVTDTYEKLNARDLTISRIIVLFLLSAVFLVAWTFRSYYLAINLYPQVSPDLILVYLPATILSGLIIALVLSTVTTFIAAIVDDWKLALIANFGFCYILGMTFGFSSGLNSYDSLAIFGPYHLYRFLSLFFSGNIVDPVFGTVFRDPALMDMIVGINFGVIDILFSLGCWIIIGVFALFFTQYLTTQNLRRLRIESNLNRFTPDDQKLLAQLKKIKQFLKQRRLVLGTVLVLMFIILPLARFSFWVSTIEENTTTLYENPSSGEMLALGSWAYGEVVVPSPPDGLNNMYQIRVEILNWGDCPDVIERHTIFDEISISDFEIMNETEKDRLIQGRNLAITPDDTIIEGGFSSIQTTGTHLWAFKFVPAEGYPLQGIMQIRISIIIRAD